MTYALVNSRTERVERIAMNKEDLVPDKFVVLELGENFSPVRRSRIIFAGMQGKSRKEILEVCERSGINPNTASVQLSKWKRAHTVGC